MKKSSLWILALPFLAGGAFFFSNHRADAQTVRVEAETKLAAGDIKVVELPDASGGKAVSIAREWQPLLIAPLPATGDSFSVWVRYKDKPILIKADLEGGQKDLGWIWEAPTTFSWKKSGRYERAQIGKNLIVIRGGDGGQGPILDAVVFATDDAYDPNNDPTPPTQNADDAAKNANLGEGAAVALGMKDRPTGQFFEAETFSAGQIIETDGASGRKAVKNDGDWAPLVSLPLPTGEAFKVWVRHKGGPFAVKTNEGDRWFWNKPNNWTWSETDVFSRAALGGQKLTIGRDAGGAKADGVQIDAVVLTPNKIRELPPNAGDPHKPAQKVAATVDWKTNAGTLSPLQWGINEQQILDVQGSSDAIYQSRMATLNSPLIRIHQADLVERWTDKNKRDWDVEKIKTGFANAQKHLRNARAMLNINAAPSWIAGGEAVKFTPAQEDEFAAFCARLVLLARENKLKVDLWELSNEWDNTFERAGELPKLWRIYNKAAAAIRKVAPDAKIGGPALTWGKPEWIEGFLDNCSDAQFFSWHTYGTGDLYESNEKIFESARKGFGWGASNVQSALKKRNRKMETFLTETNVKYTWDPYERRHQNSVGAIFNALVVQTMAQNGVTGTTLWAQKGRSFGSLVGGDNAKFPSYALYEWGPRFLSGTLAKTEIGDPKSLEIVAVTNQNGQKTLLLLNQTDHELIVLAASQLLPHWKSARQINAQTTIEKLEFAAGDWTIPAYSLTLLSSAQ